MSADVGPNDPTYLDEKSARDEFTRVATVCDGCRICADLCGVFPTLFDLLEARGGDAGRLAPAEQDEIVGSCFQCGRCVEGCPYAPDLHEAAIDVQRLVLRMNATAHTAGLVPVRARVTTWLLTRTGPLGRVVRAPGGSIRRRVAAAVSDLSATRRLPALVRPTLSVRLRTRSGRRHDRSDDHVVVYPTCVLEYHAPQVGEALIEVYERNGLGCSMSSAECCGAPWLHAGDLDRFRRVAARNVGVLASEIRRHGDVVVVPPECRHVVTVEYPRHVDTPDAQFVAERTHDAVDQLVALRPEATGELRAARISIALIGAGARAWLRSLDQNGDTDVVAVDGSAAVGVHWGWRRAHVARSEAMAAELVARVAATGADMVVGTSPLENAAIADAAVAAPVHPLELTARFGRSSDR